MTREELITTLEAAERPSRELDAEMRETAARPVADAWQPMETAPKDGRSIVACIGRVDDFHVVVYWNEVENPQFPWTASDGGANYPESAFTHWLQLPPLPAPPQESADA